MKLLYPLAALLLVPLAPARAQSVGVGTQAPDSSAVLDVSASNRGVSFPSVYLTYENDDTTIPSPAPGLMVYNTDAQMPCGKGLYFNNGTADAPVWSCFSKTTRQLHATDAGGRTNVTSTTRTPSCTLSFVVPTGQLVDVQATASIGAQLLSATAGAFAQFDAFLYLDGNLVNPAWHRSTLYNAAPGTATQATAALSAWVSGLGPGPHEISLRTCRSAGNVAITQIGGTAGQDANASQLHLTLSYR